VVVGFQFSLIPKIGPIPTPATPRFTCTRRAGCSPQSLTLKATRLRVILEQFCIANVTAQGIDRLVPGLVRHLEDGRTFGFVTR
jgi:hypothetical protein